ncbi:hypothetical protein [Deinococcus apachensis]|uniref:hypothetical protein n=1 Tax=Deinococcus apachensis TaxID=309886 RepID=UPI0003743EF7|nr:hypothetical protein [Deinococcus apachensis]
MTSRLPSYEEWRASEEDALREAREAGEAVTHPLEGKPYAAWRTQYRALEALHRSFG